MSRASAEATKTVEEPTAPETAADRRCASAEDSAVTASSVNTASMGLAIADIRLPARSTNPAERPRPGPVSCESILRQVKADKCPELLCGLGADAANALEILERCKRPVRGPFFHDPLGVDRADAGQQIELCC